MKPANKTRGTLNRFLVENFYKDNKKKGGSIKIEEIHTDDFVVINIVPSPHCFAVPQRGCSSFNNLLLTLIRIYKDLR